MCLRGVVVSLDCLLAFLLACLFAGLLAYWLACGVSLACLLCLSSCMLGLLYQLTLSACFFYLLCLLAFVSACLLLLACWPAALLAAAKLALRGLISSISTRITSATATNVDDYQGCALRHGLHQHNSSPIFTHNIIIFVVHCSSL